MRQPGVLPALIIALSAPIALHSPARAQAAVSSIGTASITAMPSPDTAVLNVGANAGLAVGMELRVMQDGREAGRIVLSQVSTDTAIGRVSSAEGSTVKVLDSVLLPGGRSVAAAPAPAPKHAAKAESKAYRPSRSDYSEHTEDVIPWERWEYMALSSLAADGLVPGYSARDFQATRQFTRGQLAALTAKALLNFAGGAGNDRDATFLRRLAEEFRLQEPVRQAQTALAEINQPRPSNPGSTTVAGLPGLSLYGAARFTRFEHEDKAGLVGRVGGIFDISANAYAVLSVNNLHRLTSPFPQSFTAVDVATINARLWDTDWELGKTYWSSGPSHAGDGLLSDNAPGLWMLKGRRVVNWGRNIKFTGTQLYGGFHDFYGNRYYGMRRMEARLSKRVDLGLGEAYISTKAPNLLSLVMPYYAYQRTVVFHQKLGGHGTSSTGNSNETFNYMAQADLFYRINRKANTYFELILDDISAPSGLGVGDVPRKLGWIWGMHFPRLFGKHGEGRFEIFNSDRETYLGIAPQVGWNERDLYLGSPFGSNTQAFYGRVDYRFTSKLKGTLQLRDAVQYHGGSPDMGDRFELALTGAYDLTPAESISIRWIPQRYRGQGYTIRPNALEVMGTYAY